MSRASISTTPTSRRPWCAHDSTAANRLIGRLGLKNESTNGCTARLYSPPTSSFVPKVNFKIKRTTSSRAAAHLIAT